MRYFEASVRHPPGDRHPMHQFVVEREDYATTRLLYRDQYADDEQAALFHVEGPREPYESALAEQPTVRDFECSPCPDTSFYLYVRSALGPSEHSFARLFERDRGPAPAARRTNRDGGHRHRFVRNHFRQRTGCRRPREPKRDGSDDPAVKNYARPYQ